MLSLSALYPIPSPPTQNGPFATQASGMNTMSFYNHWGFHMPTSDPDSLDFESGAHDLGRLYEIAKELGLFVHTRPGPYINAELNAGGMPLWITTGEYGALRDNNTAWEAKWKPYMVSWLR
jgi:beta-galactosidase